MKKVYKSALINIVYLCSEDIMTESKGLLSLFDPFFGQDDFLIFIK